MVFTLKNFKRNFFSVFENFKISKFLRGREKGNVNLYVQGSFRIRRKLYPTQKMYQATFIYHFENEAVFDL